MNGYRSERGLPPWDGKTPAGRRTSYPWSALQAGDTVFLPGRTMTDGLGSSLSRWRKANPGQTLLSRRVVEHGVAGVRVWRTA